MKPKYHLLISGVALALLLLLAFAKNTEVTTSVRWSERLLTWEDFPIIDAIPGDYHAMVYSDIQFEGDREDQSLHIYAQMIPFKSGRVVAADIDGEQLLIHEQLHFNITEYHARLFRKEAIAIGHEKLTNNDLQRLGKKYLNKIGAMQSLYDKESKHNTDWPQQRYWELHVAGLLRETVYYANPNLYSYQAFLGGSTPWFRNVYITKDGEVLPTYPESTENKDYGEVYHVAKKQDSTIIKFYKNGKPANGGYFEAALCIITFPNPKTCEVHLFDTEGKPYASENEAHITRTITDANGNNTCTFYDVNINQVLRAGVFTKKGIWDAAEKSLYISFFDKDGNPTMYRGVYHEKRIIGSNKLTERISFFNKAGKPMRDKYFVSTYQYAYDENLMVSEVKRLDGDGKYVFGLDGFHTIYEYDERANTKAEAYFDERGNPIANKEGIHKYTYTYDQYGNTTDMRKFNYRGLPTKGSDDYHQLVYLYDTVGRITCSAKYYPNYVLMFDEYKNGAYTYAFEGDSIVNVKNVDAYGIETENDFGIMLTKQVINTKKEVVRESFFGPNDTWAKTEDGVASYNYKFDERGNPIETSAFDSLGRPKAWQEDVATSRWEYDQNNNKIKTTYYTVNNKLADASQGVTYNGFKYDANNNLIERTNYDRNMKPRLFNDAFRTSAIINRFGKDSIVTSYDENNKIIANGGITKYTYNPQGVLLSESIFNEYNQPVLNPFGVHKIVYHLDKYDRSIGHTNYGKNGEKVNNTDGIAHMAINLNPSGFLLNYSFYDKNKNPVMGPEGFHRVENFFNDMDEVVRTSTYGIDGKLKNNGDGIADYVYTIDKSGRTVRISFFDADNNPVEDAKGIAEYFYTPDLNGLFFLEKQLNAKGQEVADEDI